MSAPTDIDRLVDGLQQHRAGRVDGAEAIYRQVLAENPRQGNALHLLGVLTLADGRLAECVGLLRRALGVRPDSQDTAQALSQAAAAAALLQLRAGAADEALWLAREATGCAPAVAEAWFAEGASLRALGQPMAAVAALQRAVRLDPRHAQAHLALGNAHGDVDEADLAATHLTEAIRLQPDLPEAHASLGFLLTGAGRLREAIAACDAAIALRPGFARAHWNRSFAHLLAGDFLPGWEDYEWRKRDARFAGDFPALPGREWTGEALTGKMLLVHAEQGLGDTIQFARYLPLLAARGARVVLACARPLITLLETVDGVAAAVDRAGRLPKYDLWVDQMSLPRLFATVIGSIPSPAGYLPGACAAPQSSAPLRVGLVWAGNPLHQNDRRRSIPSAALAPLFQVPGIDWVNLQVGARAGDFPDLPPPDGLTDFAATARVIATLDLVIAVDTSTAHLAGAMGRPVWLCLPAAPDWRWVLGRYDSPWYAAMRLFRQPFPGDWGSVIAQVRTALGRYRPRAIYDVASVASIDATAVATVPQIMSTTATLAGKPRMVERLVMS